MRRVRLPLIAVLLPLALVAASGCGVTADTSAATVSDTEVSADTVDTLARDTALLSALRVSCDASTEPAERQSDSVVSGCAARGVLSFEIERTAWIAEATRFGVPVDAAARTAAEAEIEGDSSIAAFRPATRKLVTDYFAAQTQLTTRFGDLDPNSDKDLRLLYDGIPQYWDRECFTGISVTSEQADAVSSALDDGTALEDVPETVQVAEQIADSATDCIPESSFPTALRDALDATPAGKVTAGVAVAGSDGTTSVYFLRVDRHERLSFGDAKAELGALLSQVTQDPSPWIQLVIQNAEVTPRYGSGLRGDSQGRLVVVAPPVPVLSSTARAAAEQADADAAAANAAAAASSASSPNGTSSSNGASSGASTSGGTAGTATTGTDAGQ